MHPCDIPRFLLAEWRAGKHGAPAFSRLASRIPPAPASTGTLPAHLFDIKSSVFQAQIRPGRSLCSRAIAADRHQPLGRPLLSFSEAGFFHAMGVHMLCGATGRPASTCLVPSLGSSTSLHDSGVQADTDWWDDFPSLGASGACQPASTTERILVEVCMLSRYCLGFQSAPCQLSGTLADRHGCLCDGGVMPGVSRGLCTMPPGTGPET